MTKRGFEGFDLRAIVGVEVKNQAHKNEGKPSNQK
jgi:hypothetical protein